MFFEVVYLRLLLVLEEEIDKFWDKVIRESLHPTDVIGDLKYCLDIFQKYPQINIKNKEQVISIIFRRIENIILDYNFGEINVLVISLLSELANISPINHFLIPGLIESIFVLFLQDDVTFEKSVLFLERLFSRKDIIYIFEDIIMVTVINLANYTTPNILLWRFICKFLLRFSSEIEPMIDYKSLEPNGVIPIFTRSYIFIYKNIYQNPPENVHEECFWELWKSVLTRYKASQDHNDPVFLFFKDLLNEIRLSIYIAFPSSFDNLNNSYFSDTSLHVWELLFLISPNEMISFLESQFDSNYLEFAKKYIPEEYKKLMNK